MDSSSFPPYTHMLSLGIRYFPFMSVHKWGENPIGRWTLRIETREPQNRDGRKSALRNPDGVVNHFGLRLFGTYGSEKSNQTMDKREATTAFVPSASELKWIYNRELAIRKDPNVMKKRDYQNLIKREKSSNEGDSSSILSSFIRKFHF